MVVLAETLLASYRAVRTPRTLEELDGAKLGCE